MGLLERIHHPDLKADQRLLVAIDELGISTRQHLSTVLGWTENSVQTYIHRWRQKGPDQEDVKRLNELKKTIHQAWGRKSDVPLHIRKEYHEIYDRIQMSRNQWIEIYYPPKHAKLSCYKLGPRALEYLQGFSSNGKIGVRSNLQWGHYLGLNDILIRLIKADPNGNLEWYGTQEATEYLFRQMEFVFREEWANDPKKARNDRRQIIRPDAYVSIDDRYYWVEFDNGSEGTRKIEEKMTEYIVTLNRIDNDDPVVWIARDEKRRDELRDIWEYKKLDFTLDERDDQDEEISKIPNMHFFKAGDEVEFFIPSLVSV